MTPWLEVLSRATSNTDARLLGERPLQDSRQRATLDHKFHCRANDPPETPAYAPS